MKKLIFLALLMFFLSCGENLEKALWDKKQETINHMEMAQDSQNDTGQNLSLNEETEPPPDEEPPPPPGDSGENTPPAGEVSDLQDIPSGRIAAAGMYLPEQVVGLRGKYIAVGAGHGYRGRSNSGETGTQPRLQRPWVWASGEFVYSSAYQSPVNNWAIVEDYMNSEIVHYLLQYLRNSGAEVSLVREQARMKEEVFVCPSATGYSEGGGTFYASSNDSAMAGRLCPSGTKYRYIYGDGVGNGYFSYSVAVPKDGYYPVYYHFRDGTDRSTQVPVTIQHAYGTTRLLVNLANRAQSSDAYGSPGLRYRVIYLGEYYFKQANPAIVTFRNNFSSSKIMVADTLRIGGGIDNIPVPVDNTVPNEERFKSSAFQYQRFLNRPSSVARLSNGYNEDVTTRPHAANYEAADAFISVHNNATGSSHPYGPNSGKGSMIIYQYGSGSTYKPLDEISRSLGRKILDQLVDYLRAKWDPNWTKILWGYDGFDGNYGEVRVAQVPAALIEVAFFTQYQDWAALSNESFYKLAAKGIYHGIAQHFGVGFSPEEVQRIRVYQTGPQSFTLAWEPPATGPAATFYVVRTSTDGVSFDGGRYTTATQANFSNVTPGKIYYFTVQAGNSHGVGLPSEVVGIRLAQNYATDKKLLIVNGFDRLDNRVNFLTTYDKRNLGPQPERGNSFSYTPTYVKAVVDSTRPWSVASCSNEAVIEGDVLLSSFDAVIWYVGRESWKDETFSYAEQVLIQNYLDSGGKLLVTGSEIGWDLAAQNIGNKHANDLAFLQNYLRTQYAGDDAGTDNLLAGSGVLSGVGAFSLDNGLQGSYKNLFPDFYNPINGSTCVQQYSVSSRCAILYFSGAYKLFHMGYPFEIIVGSSNRAQLMSKILQSFE